MFDLVVQFLTQLGGGPGPAENNLVRFGLPAIFWAVLFLVAWSRQRSGEYLPRERLLLFGFGLAFTRELFMFFHTVERVFVGPEPKAHNSFIEPLEHALALSAVLVISAAFMRYNLDDAELPRRYLLLGFAAVGTGVVISFLFWSAEHATDPNMHFHRTAGGWFMHLSKVVFVAAAIFILIKNKGWVRNVVIIALSFLLVSVLLTLVNTLTGHVYNFVLCPISNNLHIWAVPIFGFVYFHEQSLAKKEAEERLAIYHEHLEQIVDQRTTELSTTNEQLQQEIVERTRAEAATEQYARGMARLHEISLQLNATLEPTEICRLITTQATSLLDCPSAGLFRLDENGWEAVGVASHGMIAGGVDGMRLPIAASETMKRLITAGEPLIASDVRLDPRFSPMLWQHYPMRAILGVPVRGAVDLQGLLFLVESTRTRCWQESEVKLLLNFTNRAGVAWENALLHKQLEFAAALQERQRIAAEMHDGLAQTISTLALRNDQAAQMLEDGRLQSALKELAVVQEIITLAGRDLRRSIASLSESPRPRYSLQEAFVEILQSDSSVAAPESLLFSDVEPSLQLPAEQLDQIVCIVQEALLNARRHAQAKNITVHFAQSDGDYVVAIKDDGQGFDVDAVAEQPGNHFGLSIMQARAQRMGGELSVISSPDSGTVITLKWVKPHECEESRLEHAHSGLSEDISSNLTSTQGRRLWPN